ALSILRIHGLGILTPYISVFSGAGSSLESGEACCKLLLSRLSSGLSSFRCICPGELECYVYESESSVCSATLSAERVRGAVSHIGVLQFLVSEQFFPCEPEEWNCYASEHNLNQRIMRKMLPKAII
ncbi:hypothetical protein PIB30_095142, partial [Stylosanthes scabra]|nr:hypothetical protein [Stylosanthes scabra]